jgi:hypothetical protein
MAESSGPKCFLCGSSNKCIDAENIDESLKGFYVCPAGIGCQVEIKPPEKEN